MSVRIAVVQHGDYVDGLRLIAAGAGEPYFGMRNSLQVLHDLLEGKPHLLISLNAPPGVRQVGQGRFVGLPAPSLPHGVPGRIAMMLWAHRILRIVRDFRPTHVLIRTGDILAWRLLRYCVSERLSTLVMFANLLTNGYVDRQIAQLLNDPSVFLVGNHKLPALRTLLENGVIPEKAVAYDWPMARHPNQHPPKKYPAGGSWQILYVGSILESKGVTDLIEAVKLLQDVQPRVRLRMVGDGPDLPAIKTRADELLSGKVEFTGRVDNETAFRFMVESAIACVPSRHESSEAMPLSLTEALASRTPIVVSDHPALMRGLHEGEGIRFFQASNPGAMARVIRDIMADPVLYEQLSLSTAQAFARLECPVTFGDLIGRWKSTF